MKISLVAIVLCSLIIVGPILVESRYEARLRICQEFESEKPQNCLKSGFIFLWHNTCSYKCSDQGDLFLSCTKVFGIRSDDPKCEEIQCVEVEVGEKEDIQLREGNISTRTSQPSSTSITPPPPPPPPVIGMSSSTTTTSY